MKENKKECCGGTCNTCTCEHNTPKNELYNPNVAKLAVMTADLVEDETMSSFLSALPNNLGINLCSLLGVEFIAENDEFGQLVSMKLVFTPHKDKSQENLSAFKENGGMNWVDWMKEKNPDEIIFDKLLSK